jgi:hypothetical protein
MKINIPQGIVVFLIVLTLVYTRKSETKAVPSGKHRAGVQVTVNGMEPDGDSVTDKREKDSILVR